MYDDEREKVIQQPQIKHTYPLPDATDTVLEITFKEDEP